MRKTYTRGQITLAELMCNTVKQENGCVEWTGSVARNGYGQIRRNGRLITVTRLVMHFTSGFDLDSKLNVLHKCDNPKCINKDHLYTGTAKDNVNDKVSRKRHTYGHKVWKAKLSDGDIPKIFEMHKSGMGKREIARHFNIAYSSIWRILNKQAWKHAQTKEK